MKYRMSYLLMKIKILSHAYVNPNVSSKILRLALFFFIHKPLRMYIRLFQRFQKIFFQKNWHTVQTTPFLLKNRPTSTFSNISQLDYKIFHVFENWKEKCSFPSWLYIIFRVQKLSVMALHHGNSFLIIISRAHHRKAKVSNLHHANLCSSSLLLIVSRLIPLAMLFPGIKRNKYSSIFVIDRRRGLYSYFSFFLFITRLKIIASN